MILAMKSLDIKCSLTLRITYLLVWKFLLPLYIGDVDACRHFIAIILSAEIISHDCNDLAAYINQLYISSTRKYCSSVIICMSDMEFQVTQCSSIICLQNTGL